MSVDFSPKCVCAAFDQVSSSSLWLWIQIQSGGEFCFSSSSSFSNQSSSQNQNKLLASFFGFNFSLLLISFSPASNSSFLNRQFKKAKPNTQTKHCREQLRPQHIGSDIRRKNAELMESKRFKMFLWSSWNGIGGGVRTIKYVTGWCR